MNEQSNFGTFDTDLERELERLARETGLSRAEVVRRALRHYLAALYIKKVRARLRPFAGLAPLPGGEEPIEPMW